MLRWSLLQGRIIFYRSETEVTRFWDMITDPGHSSGNVCLWQIRDESLVQVFTASQASFPAQNLEFHRTQLTALATFQGSTVSIDTEGRAVWWDFSGSRIHWSLNMHDHVDKKLMESKATFSAAIYPLAPIVSEFARNLAFCNLSPGPHFLLSRSRVGVGQAEWSSYPIKRL